MLAIHIRSSILTKLELTYIFTGNRTYTIITIIDVLFLMHLVKSSSNSNISLTHYDQLNYHDLFVD